jgi:hypothetical protein
LKKKGRGWVGLRSWTHETVLIMGVLGVKEKLFEKFVFLFVLHLRIKAKTCKLNSELNSVGKRAGWW